MVLRPKRVLAIHLMIIAGLALSNLPIAVMDEWGHHAFLGYSRLMRLEEEANIPSFFSALALLACAIVAWAIHMQLPRSDRDRGAWRLMALFFGFLALDEAAMLHELGNRLGVDEPLGGLLKQMGVLLYIPVLIPIAAKLFPFWLRQEPRLRAVLVLAAVIYAGGAIGCELVEDELRALGYGNYDLPMRISFVFEESGEMIGVAVFLYAFLSRFSALGGGLLVRLAVADARQEEGLAREPFPSLNGAEPEVQNRLVSSRP